jgi:hypothetical protein
MDVVQPPLELSLGRIPGLEAGVDEEAFLASRETAIAVWALTRPLILNLSQGVGEREQNQFAEAVLDAARRLLTSVAETSPSATSASTQLRDNPVPTARMQTRVSWLSGP